MVTRQTPGWLTGWSYAHRGLHNDHVPENSIAGAKGAIDAGLGIECDVQRSRDGQPMVFHDWELDRLTDRNGLIENYDASELAQARLSNSDQKPVHLAKFLDFVDGRVPVLIEIKSRPGYDVENTCGTVAEILRGRPDMLAVMSFDPKVGEWFAGNLPECLRGLACTDSLDLGFKGAWREVGALDLASPDFLAIDIRDVPNTLTTLWREAGRPLLSWTIQTEEWRDKATQYVDAPIAEGAGLE
ncbi:MAG: glycerophosphodiester phosphodiesterase family protein [Erythrobacter sp.]